MVEYHYVEIKKALPAGANNIGSVTVVGIPTAVGYDSGRTGMPTIGIRDLSAIFEDRFYRWVNDHTCSGASELIVDANFYLNTANGYVFYVTSMCLEVLTASKWCYFELVTTSATPPGGVVTARSPRFLLDRGATPNAMTLLHVPWTVPIDIRYNAAECRTVTMRVQGQDAATHVLIAYKGYWIH